MSLLTQLRQLFAKPQSNQIIGIALQRGSLTSCKPPVCKTDINNNAAQASAASLKKIPVSSANFVDAIEALDKAQTLVGQCHLVLNAQQTQIVQVDKPNVPDDEIVSALKWQIKDLVSFSPDNMVLDYFDGPMLAGGKEKIHVVCAEKNELKKWVAAINQTDAQVSRIITEEFAFANLLPVQNDACLLVCQQPEEEIILLIVKQGRLYFYRRLRGFSQIAKKTVDELSMTMIDSLALEIQRSSDYFERQLKQAPIKEINVLLPMEQESYVARKLAENSHLPVNLLVLPDAFQAYRDYGAVIGATLPDAVIGEVPQAEELSNGS